MPATSDLTALLGQLFIIGFHGSSISHSSPIARDIAKRNLGGVILFDTFLNTPGKNGNIVSPMQLAELTHQLQSLSASKLLIGIDQEGGRVRRLKEKHGFPYLPSAAQMGDAPGYQESLLQAKTTGEILRNVGINLNFAPVADLNLNPQSPVIGKIARSFSADPAVVTKHCEIWLDELHKAGVLGCLKHFPGHGSSTVDSHEDFVDISKTWNDQELRPYRDLIERGKVPAIMTGHLFHKDFDEFHPASLSRNTINGFLRGEMLFEGAVITDDLQMKAITSRYGLLDAILLALNGGVDMIIIGNNLAHDQDILARTFDHIDQAIGQNKISIDTLEKAYNRVQRLKDTLP